MRTMALRFFVVSLFVGLFASAAWAQQAELSGVVRDSSGAVVPNVTVRAIQKDTGTSRTAQTNAEGVYTLPYLQPGVYDVVASARGFKRTTHLNLTLEVAGKAVLDFTLEVGAVTQAVTVSGGGMPLLQTGDASVGTVITGKETTQLPLNGRYFTSLLDLVPGTIQSTYTSLFENSNPSKAGREFNGIPVYDVNGQSGAYVVSRIDGIDNAEREFGGQLIPVSVDAIQEFKLQTSNYSAEYGHGSGQIDIVTKSGTNQIHGDVFEFLRNNDFDATQWLFTGAHSSDRLKQNQFGGTFGGPIRKDKLFYFFSFDGTRQTYSSPETLTLPSTAMRAGTFPSGVIIFDPQTQQPFPGNTIPQSAFNPTSVKILQDVLPTPNLPGITETNKDGFELDPVLNYFTDPRQTQNINQFSGRIDYNLSARDVFFSRYTYSSNQIVSDGMLSSDMNASIVGSEHDDLGGQNLSVGWEHTFSPTMINEARFGVEVDPDKFQKGDNTTDWASILGVKQFLAPNALNGLPYIKIGSVNMSSGRYLPTDESERNFLAIDELTLVRHAHTISLGGGVRPTALPETADFLSVGGFFFNGAQTRNRNFPSTATTYCPGETVSSTACSAGDSMADFLLGDLSQFESGTPLTAYTNYYSSWDAYINDAWRVRRKLTLTLGLRYDYTTREHSNDGLISTPIISNGEFSGSVGVATVNGKISSRALPQVLAATPGVYVPCSQFGLPAQTCMVSDKRDWQPRVGIAWKVNDKTVVRTGGGIFYGYPLGNGMISWFQNPPFINTLETPTFTRPPAGTAAPPLSLSNPLTSVSSPAPFLYGGDPHSRVPAAFQYNFTVERQLTPTTALSVGYVGVSSWHLEVGAAALCCYYNVPQPEGVVLAPGQAQVQAHPDFAPMEIDGFIGTSNYNSLQVQLNHRTSHGLSLSASYTYSKNMQLQPGLSDPLDYSVDYGPASNDVRHNFVIAPIWDLPFGKGQRWVSTGGPLNQLIGGWRFTSIFSLRSGFPFTPTLSGTDLLNDNGYAGADRPNRVCSGTLSSPTVFNWFNKSCFILPVEPTTPGAALVPGNSGPDILSGPGALAMDVGLSKTFPLTERVGLEFRVESFNVLNHPEFGLPNSGISPTGTSTPAEITSTVSLPRIIQFALKLHF